VGERGRYQLTQDVRAILVPALVPATMQAVVAARIDRHPPEAKHLLQSAAVIGHEVPFSLLRAITETPQDDLQVCLARLQSTEFLYEHPGFPEPRYAFWRLHSSLRPGSTITAGSDKQP